ncbi:hypothetical protein QN277_000660 [Acacia crassicarpa]|uniref:Secreted protein n=1 Tax=Acacia crassicarpa TaxID=499986 RepID=A0AAE1N5M9_9FABA|nr:hypothetical protein QN277_000660 [Acacia crassicarpa]
MSVRTWMLMSLVRLMACLVLEPASSISTILYYSHLLPQSLTLLRMVRHEMLDQENFLFNLIISFMTCFN